jgi:DNA-binding protein H-NS
MAELDLTSFSESDLRDLAKKVESELENRESQKKKIVLDQIKELAQSIGMTVDQIVTAERKGGKKLKAAAGAVYVNPDNPKQTWSGKGRRPKWAKEMLEQGKKLAAVGG